MGEQRSSGKRCAGYLTLRRWLGICVAAALVTATGFGGRAEAADGPCGGAGTPPARYEHVVVFGFENRTWSHVGGPGFGSMPYLHGLATQCAYFTDWIQTNPFQNSLTQYIGLTSGVNNPRTVNDCAPRKRCRSKDNNIFRQVRVAGGTARDFVEGPSQGCSSTGTYSAFIPGLYYYGRYRVGATKDTDRKHCNQEVRPFGELNPNALPTFAFITPSPCNNGHGCGNSTVDSFASTWVQRVIDGASYQAGTTAIFVVYDEDHPVPNLVIAPTAGGGAISTPTGSHAALLKAIENMLGLPVMAQGQLPAAVDLRGPANV